MGQHINRSNYAVILPGALTSTARCVACAPPELAEQESRHVPTSIIALKVFGGEGRYLDGTLQ